MTPMTHDEAEDLVQEIDCCGSQLTDWEAEFIDSMLKALDDPNWTPTRAQIRQIHRIYRTRLK